MTNPDGPESSGDAQLALSIAQHRAEAYRVARRLVRSDAEAEDLTQTAILNVLRNRRNIQDVDHVKAYLFTSVRNLWRNQLRQQGRRRFVGTEAAEYIASDDASPEEQALDVLDVSVASAAFASLSGTSRTTLLLRYVEGLTYAELAQRLHISTVAARQRAHRAREELISACIEETAQSGAAARCSTVRGRLGRYLRGRLNQYSRAQIAIHLEECRSCAVCYTQLIDLYGHLLRREASDS
jgi:RNA polymerase sigma-70 factor (ECF subfamily)